jgi:hypothetical protein
MARDVRRIALCVLAAAMVMVSGGLSLSTTALPDDIPGSPVQTPSPVQPPIPTPSPTRHPAAPPATPTAGPQVTGGPAPVSWTDTPPAPISSPLITGGEILWIHSGPTKQDPSSDRMTRRRSSRSTVRDTAMPCGLVTQARISGTKPQAGGSLTFTWRTRRAKRMTTRSRGAADRLRWSRTDLTFVRQWSSPSPGTTTNADVEWLSTCSGLVLARSLSIRPLPASGEPNHDCRVGVQVRCAASE